MKTPNVIQAVAGRARSWLNRRSHSATSSGRPAPWLWPSAPASAVKPSAPRVSSPSARADAEKVLADLQNSLKAESRPRLIVKPTPAAPSAMTTAAPAAPDKATPAVTANAAKPDLAYRRGLEYMEGKGTLSGVERAQLAMMREEEAKAIATTAAAKAPSAPPAAPMPPAAKTKSAHRLGLEQMEAAGTLSGLNRLLLAGMRQAEAAVFATQGPLHVAAKAKTTSALYRRGLEYLESKGRLFGIDRAALAQMREADGKASAGTNQGARAATPAKL